MTITFILLCIGWLISIGIWFYTILNEKRRENFDYIFPLIAVMVFHIAIYIVSYFM